MLSIFFKCLFKQVNGYLCVVRTLHIYPDKLVLFPGNIKQFEQVLPAVIIIYIQAKHGKFNRYGASQAGLLYTSKQINVLSDRLICCFPILDILTKQIESYLDAFTV